MRPLLILFALFVSAGASPALAASAVTVTPAAVMPTKAVTVSGSGFAANEAVDVYFDTNDVRLVVSGATGAFSTSLQVPSYASPGAHTVTGVGRRAGDAAQGSTFVTTPWRQFGFGAPHRGWNPYENTLDYSTVQNLGTDWINSSLPGTGSTPAVVYPNVYVTTMAGVAALNAATDAVIWKDFPGQHFYACPTVTNYVYVASDIGNVYALNPATGATVWGHGLGGVIYGSVSVAGGIAYVGNYSDGTLYALNASTGATLWTYKAGSGIASTPTIANGVVYFGSLDSNVYALNATTGSVIWTHTTGNQVASSAAVVNGVLYIGSLDSTIYALNADTGSVRWTYVTGDEVLATPAVVSGTLYAGSNDRHMYAIDARSGTLKWSFTAASELRSAAVANGVVYFTSHDGTFYALDAYSGSQLATGTNGGTYLGTPAISDGVVYLDGLYGGTTIRAMSSTSETMARMKKPRPPPKPSELHPDLSLTVSR